MDDKTQGHNMDEHTKPQAIPKGSGSDIVELVKKDLDERAKLGFKKYGERLKPFNGRNALWDAYQEALDLANYLRQAIEQEKVNNENR